MAETYRTLEIYLVYVVYKRNEVIETENESFNFGLADTRFGFRLQMSTLHHNIVVNLTGL